MKVLLVANSLGGGAGKACLRLYYALRGAGVDVRLLYLEPGRQPDDPNIAPFYGSVSRLFLRQLIMQPLLKLKAVLAGDPAGNYRLPVSIHRLENHAWVGWADVVNLHWVPNFVDYKRFFSRVGRKPIVWTMHDLLPFSGGFHYRSEIQNRDVAVEQRIKRSKEKAVSEANLSIVAPSSWALAESQKYGTFSACRHTHIFNGVPLDVFQPLSKKLARSILGLPVDSRIVLFVADSIDSKRKGIGLLVEAMALLKDANITFVSIGGGSMPVDSSFPYISLGSMSDDVALAIAYASADVAVVPSVEDNSPNTILESLACGRPVIGMNNGGIPQLVCSEHLGVVLDQAQPEGLAEAIKTTLATDYSEDSIRRYAQANFDLGVLASRYIAEFERAI